MQQLIEDRTQACDNTLHSCHVMLNVSLKYCEPVDSYQ